MRVKAEALVKTPLAASRTDRVAHDIVYEAQTTPQERDVREPAQVLPDEQNATRIGTPRMREHTYRVALTMERQHGSRHGFILVL